MAILTVVAITDIAALGISAALMAVLLGPPLALFMYWQLASGDGGLERASDDVARYLVLKDLADEELSGSLDYFAADTFARSTERVSRYIAVKEQADRALYPRLYADQDGEG